MTTPTDEEPVSFTGAPWTPEPGAIEFLPEIERGMTDEEVYAFLSRDRPEAVFPAQPDEVIVAAADVHDGAMVALIPAFEDLERLELEAGEPLGELHITAYYLGDAVSIDDQTRADIVATLEEMLTDQDIVTAIVFGIGIFNPLGEEPCLVLNVAGGGLEAIRNVILEALTDADAPEVVQHEPWVPHITLAYDDGSMTWDVENIAPQRMGPITIDRVRVAFGGEVTDIPLGLNAIAAATHVFHMPGKHDQSAHGRGGASPSELAMGERLNAGKRLDPNDPEQANVARGITMWTTGGQGLSQVKLEMTMEARTPGQNTPGAALLRVTAGAPANAPELYRGLSDVNPSHIPAAGQVVKLGPTSFTRDKGMRDEFAMPTTHSSFGHNTSVRITLKKNSRSLRIDQEAVPSMKREKEHITTGKFRVTKSSSREVEMKTFDGKKGKVTLFEVEFEQVDDLTPTTTSSRETVIRPEGW